MKRLPVRRLFQKTLLIIIALLIMPQSGVLAATHSVPFSIPEKFIYELTWTGIKAGTASLELRNEGEQVKIVSTAQSAPFISTFYKVDNLVESTLLRESLESFFQPSRYRLKIREGRYRRDKEVIFTHGNNKVVYIDHLKNEKKEIDITQPVFDPLSGFYHIRTLKLSVGQPVHLTIFDSKKVWDIEVQVLRKEKVTLPTGTVNTFVIKPMMKSEGIFSRKGEMLIWLTDDGNRIPVKMQTKVAIGSITATLVRGFY